MKNLKNSKNEIFKNTRSQVSQFFLKSTIWTIWKGRNFIDAGGLREVPQSNIFYSVQSKEL
jgi:hypothetical protein